MRVTPLPAAATLPLVFDPVLIKRLTQSGPRYSSYPSAEHFATTFGYRDYLKAVADLRTRGIARPLSLYLHIPFCDSVCYYCNCNKIVTKNRDQVSIYLSYLKREIEMQGRLFAGMNQIEQLHFGGGTPTYLSEKQMDELMLHLRQHFEFASDEDGEYSIEIDPRTVSRERVFSLRAQGFNRISLGVQDFDADVQKAVNRIQPEAETVAIMQAARSASTSPMSTTSCTRCGWPPCTRPSLRAPPSTSRMANRRACATFCARCFASTCSSRSRSSACLTARWRWSHA